MTTGAKVDLLFWQDEVLATTQLNCLINKCVGELQQDLTKVIKNEGNCIERLGKSRADIEVNNQEFDNLMPVLQVEGSSGLACSRQNPNRSCAVEQDLVLTDEEYKESWSSRVLQLKASNRE